MEAVVGGLLQAVEGRPWTQVLEVEMIWGLLAMRQTEESFYF